MPPREKARPSVSGVAAVDRAFAILAAFRRGDRSLELTELAARTGLVKSTIMRLAVSLENLGLLARQPDGAYRLGHETLRLGSVYQSSLDLEDHVMPVLEKLVEATEESASFYVRRGNQRLCLFRVDSPHRLRLVVLAGEMRPMDQSAIAQVLRGFGTTSTVDPEGRMPPLYTSGATDPHTAAMAMPVFGADRRQVGALALSGPVARLTNERFAEIAPVLQRMAAELSRSIGCSEVSPA
ncbi:MAG: IclR family transcriptional regulator [Proteobacteria bacterium]|nr:IclR family transcriptional regulator [Pseudomonadota bacterium]